MRAAFYNATNFNRDIGRWDTSKVTNMNAMFQSARIFDQDLSKWTVDAVTAHSSFSDGSALTPAHLPSFKS